MYEGEAEEIESYKAIHRDVKPLTILRRDLARDLTKNPALKSEGL